MSFFDFDSSMDDLNQSVPADDLQNDLAALEAELSQLTDSLHSPVVVNGNVTNAKQGSTLEGSTFPALPSSLPGLTPRPLDATSIPTRPTSAYVPNTMQGFIQPPLAAEYGFGWLLTQRPCPHTTTCPGKGLACLYERDGERICASCNGKWQKKKIDGLGISSRPVSTYLDVTPGFTTPVVPILPAAPISPAGDSLQTLQTVPLERPLSVYDDPPPRGTSFASPSPKLGSPSRPASSLIEPPLPLQPVAQSVSGPVVTTTTTTIITPEQSPSPQPFPVDKKKGAGAFVASLFAVKAKKKSVAPSSSLTSMESLVTPPLPATMTLPIGSTTVVSPETSMAMPTVSTPLPIVPMPLEKTRDALSIHIAALQNHLERVNIWMHSEKDHIFHPNILENSRVTTEAISSAMRALKDL